MSLSTLKAFVAALLLAGFAVAAAPAQAQSTFEAQLLARIQQLEVSLAQMNGQIQDLQYKNQQLSDQLTRALNDVDFRLTELEGGSGGGSGGSSAPAAPPAASPSSPPIGPTPLPLIPPKRGDIAPTEEPMTQSGMGLAGVDSVGGLTQPTSEPITGTTGSPQTFDVSTGSTLVMPMGDPASQYNWAYGYVRQGDYRSAISAMTQFIQANPTDGLAGNAQYWLGESYWAQGQAVEAAQSFRTAYQWDPHGSKAPDSLLRLGQAYAAIGQPADACTAFLRLANDFPSASPQILQQLQVERTRAAC